MHAVPGFAANVAPRVKTKPWLVIGKGPSFSKVSSFDLRKYHSVALNHAVNKIDGVDYVHVADLDVFDKISNTLESCKATLVTPYFLHSENKASVNLSVDSIVSNRDKPHHELFSSLFKQNRLLTYRSSNLNYMCKRKDIGRTVYVRYFSSVAVINLLAVSGVKNITIVGIDGGTKYDKQFSDLTALTNGRKSFDVQFKEIAVSTRRYKLDLKRITCDD
jgi:hypothetical protein